MQSPLFIYTDASFEVANDTATVMVEHAKDAGYDRVGIIDVNSASSVVRFVKKCADAQVGALVGATLEVSIPSRDKTLWALKNERAVNQLYSHVEVTPPPPSLIYDEIEQLIAAITSGQRSKAKNKHDILNGKLSDIFSKRDLGEIHFKKMNDVELKSAAIESKYIDLKLSHGTVTVVAESAEGYKSVLRLISIRSLNKQHNIKQGANEKPLALTWDDYENEAKDVLLFDSLSEKSVLGAFSGLNGVDESVLSDLAAIPHIKNIGLDYPLTKSQSDWVGSLSKNLPEKNFIPMPTAQFAQKESYSSYKIKVAVHRGVSINDMDFIPPNKEKYIHPSKDVFSYMEASSKKMDVDIDFWSDIADTDVPLGNIDLPNYDMPVLEVINYAYELKGKEERFTDENEAVSAFKDWIAPDCPEKVSQAAFYQRRMNDFCMHKISLEGVKRKVYETFDPEDVDKHMPEYLARHEMEYGVIEGMGFSGYFLIEYDVVITAREMGVPVGDGRGSAAGSLIVYGMEITDVDPIEYGLQFERFLNPERVSMPDIDVDFGAGRNADRNSVLEYISRKYQLPGSRFPSSSQIANMNHYQLKSAISSVRKAMGLSMTYENYIKFLISQVESSLGINSAVASVKWDQLLDHDLIRPLLNTQPVFKQIFKHALALTGKKSTFGVHAGGVVIAPTTITDYSAIECDDKGNFFSQFDKDDIESAGLVKLDVLGLRNLSIVDEAVLQIEQNHGVTLDPRKLDKHDEKVFNLMCDQVLSDVFQLESDGMRKLVGHLQPRSIGEIAVLSALYRPGALDSGMVEEYIDVKFDKKAATYDHPALETVTKETFGCIVYQEQVMSIVRELAGYSLGEADILRRAMGKKKIEEMTKQKKVYNSRAQDFWREHYLDIGIKQNFKFKLDVCLNDIRSELQALGIEKCIDDLGYLSVHDEVIDALVSLLKMKDDQKDILEKRLNDFNYVVRLFKQHYHASLTTAVKNGLSDLEVDKVEEVTNRLYFALTQYVRFNQVFLKVEKFAGYGFNKSHAVAYSIITYKTAYLKAHYPVEFYSAAMSFRNLDQISGTVFEASQAMGIKVLPPSINDSDVRFKSGGMKSIRYGLGKLRDMGKSAADVIKEREANDRYLSMFDFLHRLKGYQHKPGSDSVKSLSTTGAFDTFIPKRVSAHDGWNGREFMVWLRNRIIPHKSYKNSEDKSPLHDHICFMDETEFYAYVSAIAGASYIKKFSVMPEDDQAFYRKKVTKENSIPWFNNIINGELDPKSVMSKLSSKTLQRELTPFELEFVRAYYHIKHSENAKDNWNKHFDEVLNKSVIETLNSERHYAGIYLTSNPIRVLKVADKVEREPPSSIIDGCPVNVGLIDDSYNEQRVTTYGIVRNVVQKTVKREDSVWFGENMLFFNLENGADNVNCMIFGNKPVKEFNGKLIEDGAVMLVAGEVSCNNFGITLGVEAIKRYYPTEDEKLHVVPKVKKR